MWHIQLAYLKSRCHTPVCFWSFYDEGMGVSMRGSGDKQGHTGLLGILMVILKTTQTVCK